MIQYEIKITGKVHGVGFRYFAQLKANEIGVTGWVKNNRDGTVLIMAQGDETDLNTFIDYLQIGPTRARVNKISRYKMELLSDFDIFSVKY
jgi:acylphosphatase